MQDDKPATLTTAHKRFDESWPEYVERAVAEERERCAQICIRNMDEWNTAGWRACAEEILREIRKG